MFMSASLNSMLGVALLLLWRLDRQHRHVWLWGWSWVLLGLGLIAGPTFQDAFAPGRARDLQALVAATALMASLFLQLVGALHYRGLRLPPALFRALFVVTLGTLAALGARDFRSGLVFGAIVLALGSTASGVVMWRGGDRNERMVAVFFLASALVHLSGPVLDERGRSGITYTLGLYVQTLLSLAQILLSVARARREVRKHYERFMRLAEQSLQGLAVAQQGQVVYANPAVRTIFGFEDTHGEPRRLLADLVPAHQREEASRRHARVLASPGERLEWEAVRLRGDGREVHIRAQSSYIEWDGQPAELLLIIDDTSRHLAEQALRRQALHDELTDLPNRNCAVERLRALSAPGAAPPLPAFAVMSADLDRFQLVNETMGHDVGDALLHAIARRLDQQLPEGCMLARLGEDQFLVIAERATGPVQAQAVVDGMMGLLEAPFAVAGSELFVHMSIGVALYPQDALDASALLRCAESAMHRAKHHAGVSAVFFDRTMDGVTRARLEAEQSLGRALAAREFLLEYQPKFAAGTRALCGMEALVRWERPDRGRVSPAEFIPAAERTGQIKALGEMVLELVCVQLSEWSRRFERVPPVAVNVSPLQFNDAGFAERLLSRLHALHLPTELLQIEITETAAIGHLARVLPQLQLLREHGVLCALDDFGTGQSSLTVLRQLPISTLKLDRSMIAPLPAPDANAVVQATCMLGRSLRLEIVAEGVETEEQARAAEALGCTELQGYLLGKPVPARQLEALLRAPSFRPA
jgi:diguanylate cyclase (GGDEF)-like protein/PAS domain S-box-containing protein